MLCAYVYAHNIICYVHIHFINKKTSGAAVAFRLFLIFCSDAVEKKRFNINCICVVFLTYVTKTVYSFLLHPI